MQKIGGETRIAPTEPALRIIMRRLREIMAEASDGQSRLDKIVRQIAGLMVAEVSSIYLKRQDGSLELFATEGLNPGAVHNTLLKRGEGLVGRCAELAVPINEPDAQNHPAFSYRPETGEEIYHSFLAVPVLRGGDVLGVLTVQNKTQKDYSDEDLEVLQTTAMVLAEHLVSGAVAGVNTGAEFNRAVSHVVRGQPMSEGIALGHAVVHEPRVFVTAIEAKDPDVETARLEAAVDELKASIDEMLDQGELADAGEHRDVLEAYRMFAHDRGWLRRMKEAIRRGMTAEAAVERVQNDTRARMLRQADAYWHERLKDLDALSDRLLRVLAGGPRTNGAIADLPHDTILVARSMGPADLLDYDRSRLRGLVIEDSGGQSHVAIVAKALGIPAIGDARGVIDRVDQGNPIIVDAESGEVHIRPNGGVIAAYGDKARFRARRQRKYRALRDRPAITKDGQRIELHINAGLQIDVPYLAESGADGIGLFRTELQFMLSAALPRLERQTQMYRTVVEQARGKPVVFRTLDVGGDKALPYLRQPEEENPALGWRAIRLALDRPVLLRTQVRALLRATAGQELRMLLPMVTTVGEVDMARAFVDRELKLMRRRGGPDPTRVLLGAMIEVPSLLYELDALLPRVDFVSVGSNDLLQYLFAADRNNSRVSTRYDALSAAPLRALRSIVDAAKRHNRPFSLCGEMAGRPLEAMPPIGLVGAVLGSIIAGVAAPSEAASMGALGSIVVAVLGGRFNWKVLTETVQTTTRITAMVMFILICAQVFALAFRGLQGERLVQDAFTLLPGGINASIWFLMLIIFVLGFFIEWIEISYIAVPLFLPVFAAANVDMIWLAILICLNLQASFLTPPFGWSLFFLRGVAPPEVTTGDIYRGIVPFVLLQLVALVLVFWYPGIATWLPRVIGW